MVMVFCEIVLLLFFGLKCWVSIVGFIWEFFVVKLILVIFVVFKVWVKYFVVFVNCVKIKIFLFGCFLVSKWIKDCSLLFLFVF